jgi:hypothetical protein
MLPILALSSQLKQQSCFTFQIVIQISGRQIKRRGVEYKVFGGGGGGKGGGRGGMIESTVAHHCPTEIDNTTNICRLNRSTATIG